MTNTPYNQLRQLLTERLPHLKELSFGCEVIRGSDFGGSPENVFIGKPYQCTKVLGKSAMQVRNPWNIDDTDDLLKILGRPVTLEDILIAAKKVINNKPEAFFVPYHIIVSDVVIKSRWHLGKPLHDQSVETLQFIRDILK